MSRLSHFDDFDNFDLRPQSREMFESPSSVELPHPPDLPLANGFDGKRYGGK